MATMFKMIIRRFVYNAMHDKKSLCGTKLYDLTIYQAEPEGDRHGR